MDEKRARLILESYRPGVDDPGDPSVAEALQEVAANPGLAQWFAEEQAFDRAIAAQLEAVPAPFGLKTRILAEAVSPVEPRPWSWVVKLAAVAALLFLLVQVVGLFRVSAPAKTQDFAREMLSFIRIDPPLDMKSSDLGEIRNWLAKKDAAPMEIPPRLVALQPVGCRVLSFRGQKVVLICFRREGDRLAHLFVVDRAALPTLESGGEPVFSSQGEWTTAAWADKDRAYMIAVQGDRAAAKRYLPDA